jgi:RHS repeat-associated protein
MNPSTPFYTRLFAALINSHLSFVLTVSIFFLVGFAVVAPSKYQPVDAHTGPNSAPTAVDDGPYTVHESLLLPQVMGNDFDADGDTIVFDLIGTNPTHGNLTFGATPGVILYRVTQPGYVGPDSFTYRIGDQHGAKSTYATVNINVVNQSPVAATDNYTVHGATMLMPHPKANDSDPDGDPIFFDIVVTPPAHGNVSFPDSVNMRYTPQPPYVGPDSFTYRIKDSLGAIAIGTVNLDVQNQPPTPVTDNYTVHGPTMLLPHPKANDFDPDGDTFIFDVVLTGPAHGSISFPDGVNLVYTPNPSNYTGPDSFTYRIRDSLSMNATGTVNLTVQNQAPVAVDDGTYKIRGSQLLDPNVMLNDYDPDGDPVSFDSVVQNPAHGSLSIGSGGAITYTPQSGYEGSDSFTYKIRDSLIQRSNVATVTLRVLGSNEKVVDPCGRKVPEEGPRGIGEPVDVTTGNMYLQQTDHLLPGAGPHIQLLRTYNSKSTWTGLFGKGWSTAYDEALQVFDSDFVRLNEPTGRATYFERVTGTSVFTPIEGDFHGQLTQTAGGYTLSMKDGSNHQFNSTGRLLSSTDRNGNQTTLTYNVSGKLSSVIDPFGRLLSFVFNGDRVSQIMDTTGVLADYTYSNVSGSNQKLLTVTYADTSGYTFAYDASHRLTTVSDKLNNVLEAHVYDGQGRATSSEKHGGVEHYTLNYVSATETDVTDALGHVTKYFFNATKARNFVTSVEGVCACGGGGSQVTTWAYDNNFNVSSSTDALGHATSYTYDTAGNVLTVTNPTGTVTYTYNSFGQVLTYTDQMGGVTTNTYNVTGDLLTTKDALNNTTTFTYDSRGQLLTATDPRNKVTTYTWDTSGRLTQMLDALNNVTSFAYDLRARVTSITNALNHTTSYEYDAVGRLKKVIYPDTTFGQYTYDLGGRRTKVRDARGNETNFAYDSAYRLTSITDALNHTISYGYDAMSNRTSMTDALSRVTNYEYDDFNRLKKTIYPPAVAGATRLEETIAYDSDGNISKKTDTAGRDTTYAYDAAHRLITSTDPALQVTQFQYNARSQNTKVIDALSQEYQFTYDALGRVTQMTRAGVPMSYVYDANGNRTQRTDYNGAVTNYTFDDLNRLTNVAYPDLTTATLSYDAISRVTSAANQNGTVTFVYDSRGRMTSTTDVWGQTIGYSYDPNGNRTGLTVGGSSYATYQYDAVDKLTNLADAASQNFVYNYDVVNRLTSRVAPNGVTASFTYDDMDRLFELAHTKSPATLSINQYGYNNANQIASWLGSAGNRSFNYDAADRLLSMLKMGGNENYTYDAVGNRTASHLSATYGYQAVNKLTSTASATYTYNDNGNMLSKTDGSGTRNFIWDSDNRLKQVTLPSGVTVNYKYDPLGRRIQRTTSAGGDERFVYDGQNVLLDLDSSGAVVTSYLNGIGSDDHLRQTNTTTGVSYFLTDHLGTTATLTDATGNVVETLNYDSFGNNAGSALTRYTYTGREQDPDTGLLYYRARFYDPELGRFISEDPIGLKGGNNLFAYVSNNPARFTDPSGLCQLRPKDPCGGPTLHPVDGARDLGKGQVSQWPFMHWSVVNELNQALAEIYRDIPNFGFTEMFRPTSYQTTLYNQYQRNLQAYNNRFILFRGSPPLPADPPGSSAHEAGVAFDVPIYGDSGRFSRDEIWIIQAILARHGFVQGVPGDPVHFVWKEWLSMTPEQKKKMIEEAQSYYNCKAREAIEWWKRVMKKL